MSFNSIGTSVPAGTCANTCCCTNLKAIVKICTVTSDVPVRPGMWRVTGCVPSAGLGYRIGCVIPGCCVYVGVSTTVFVKVSVAVAIGVDVGVIVFVAVGILVLVGFGVLVHVDVGTGVQLLVGVAIGVAVEIAVVVGVGVLVARAMFTIAPTTG